MRSIYMAVVDDNKAQNELVMEKLRQISQLDKFDDVEFSFKSYLNGIDLLHSEQVYDLIIMDYEMPVMNGVEVAEELYKRGSNSKIIFLSGYDDLFRPLQKSISNKLTVGFVLKSDPPEEFQHQVVNALEDVLDVHFITISHFEIMTNIDTGKNGREFYKTIIDAKKIVTIESEKKNTFIYAEGEPEFLTNTPLKEWLSELWIIGLVQVNRKCLVNLKFVNSISWRTIQLHHGEAIVLGTNYKKTFHEKWELYKARETKT